MDPTIAAGAHPAVDPIMAGGAIGADRRYAGGTRAFISGVARQPEAQGAAVLPFFITVGLVRRHTSSTWRLWRFVPTRQVIRRQMVAIGSNG